MTTSPSPPNHPGDLAIQDAAKQISCCTRTLRKAIAQGFLPAYRIGNRIFVITADLEAYILNRAVPVYPDVLAKKAAYHQDLQDGLSRSQGDNPAAAIPPLPAAQITVPTMTAATPIKETLN